MKKGMNHLLTLAQFLARRFSKEHNRRIIIREGKRMKKMLGSCQWLKVSRASDIPERLRGKVVYIVRLNIHALDNFYDPEETRQIIMHELVHTLEYNHGARFRKICTHYGVSEKQHGPVMKE